MKNKKIIIGIIIFIVFLVGAISIVTRKIDYVKPVKKVETVDTATTTKAYSLKEVQVHNNPKDCWTTINGKVYNVTSWISEHPGGSEAIIYLCGIDGSSAFNGQHGGQKRPESELAGFIVGVLVK